MDQYQSANTPHSLFDKDSSRGTLTEQIPPPPPPPILQEQYKPQEVVEITTDVSCERCRKRRVKCNRSFPRCSNCTNRGENCNLKNWVEGGGRAQPGRPVKRKRGGDNYENTELPIPSERPPLTSPPVAPPTSSDPSPSSSFSSQPSNRQNFPFLSISSVLLKRRQPRQALLHTFIQGESALYPLLKNNNDSNYRSLELDSLSIQLETNCSSSSSSISSSTCFFFPSSSSPPPTLTEPQILTPQEVSQALSIYFSQLEPSFKLFPTNSSRNYLSSRIEQFWSTTQTQGEVGRGEDFLEWKALFLVTVAGSAVVSTDSEWIEKGKELIKVASRIVLKDLRFASNPTTNSLRTLLIILNSSLLAMNQTSTTPTTTESDSLVNNKVMNLEEIFGFFPILVKAGFKLELHLDHLNDINFPTTTTTTTTGVEEENSDELEERRVIWNQLVKIETIWSTLFQTPLNSMVDLSINSTTTSLLRRNLLDPTLFSSPPTPTSSPTIETIISVVSQLSKTVFSSTTGSLLSPPPVQLQNLLQTLIDCQVGIESMRGEGQGGGGNTKIVWKALLGFAVLRFQTSLQELDSVETTHYERVGVLLNDNDWLIQVENLFQLVRKVSECDMLDRLPSLLLILQGATLVVLRLSSLSLSQLGLRLSITSQLNNLTNDLRTTPWPSYMHLFVKRGVIVLEHLTLKINESLFELVEPMISAPLPPPPPSNSSRSS
ncbi:hypothetical protein JCM5350_004939 [Sporobolomyces pararoseus]